MDDREKAEERYCLYCDMTNQLDEECRPILEYDSIPHNYRTETMHQAESQTTHIVGKNPGITAAGIVALLIRTPSACSQLIQKLREKGWIKQIRNPENNREYQLLLTEFGWKIYRERNRSEQAYYKRSFNNLKESSEEDLKKYTSIQKRLDEAFVIDVKENKNT